ncbi:hypothetical protein [Streptomyces sp. NPDC055189]
MSPYALEATPPTKVAAHVVRLCGPAVEIVNGGCYDRDQRIQPTPAATEDRTLQRLNRLADLLVDRNS